MQTLFTWLGNRDIENMEQGRDAAIVSIATEVEIPFDKIVILSNKAPNKWNLFERFLKKSLDRTSRPSDNIKIHFAKIRSPIDYQSIAVETEKWITKLSEESDALSINLTSGTPAMTTLAVLHGKGKSNTRFVQSSPKNVIVQTLLFTDPSQIDLARQALMVKIEKLQMHLNEVRAKASFIADIQKEEYWRHLTALIDGFETLETSRKALRSFIHLREKGIQPPSQEVILDIREDEADYQVTQRPTKIMSIDYQIFRQEVEKTLAPLFETDSVLQKIRAGSPVTLDDIARSNALVHIQNPNVDLNTLEDFYLDSTASLDKILRIIVGMDKGVIEQSFTKFVQQTHNHMNAKQQRFIGLLKNYLVRYGAIKIDQLYDAPFTQVHDMGLDGVFSKAQADVFEQFIKQFDVEVGDKTQTVNKEVNV